MDEFPDKYESIGVFSYVLITLRWNLAFKHGQVQHSLLAEALGSYHHKTTNNDNG